MAIAMGLGDEMAMGDNREMSTTISNGLRGRLGVENASYKETKRRGPPQKNTVKLKASSFDEYQVKSERSFAEKPSKLRASEGGGGKHDFYE